MELLKIKNLGKAYLDNTNPIRSFVNTLLRRSDGLDNLNWIIKNINFSAYKGESIAIIGKNGAGKSTLLSIIAGNVSQTSGNVYNYGRVSAILELGSGFNPDFTGRENAENTCRIQGFSTAEIEKYIPEIQQFADIGNYFDENVSTYSTGMLARLAFATAIAKDPEILIVDEAISVGDLSFQAKCMQKMTNLKNNGTCILLVSHSLNLIREFCDKGLYIVNNKQSIFGEIDYICDKYQNDQREGDCELDKRNTKSISMHIKESEENRTTDKIKTNPELRKHSSIDNPTGTLQLEFIDFKVMNKRYEKINHISYNERIQYEILIKANEEIPSGSSVGILVADKNGYQLFSCNINHYNIFLPEFQKNDICKIIISYRWPFRLGEFRLDVGIKPDPIGNIFYDRIFAVCTLSTPLEKRFRNQNFGSYLYLDATIDISKC